MGDGIRACRNKYREEWGRFRGLGATVMDLEVFCERGVQGGFGELYHRMRVELN